MDMQELYIRLERLTAKGQTGNAYGGCGDAITSPDSDVLIDFYDLISEKYRQDRPPWAEAFLQIFNWQFETFHECSRAYYDNSYGISDYAAIKRVAAYLQKNGYDEIAGPYGDAAVDCAPGKYPEECVHLLPDDWMRRNEETVWKFYVRILEENKAELLQ